MTEWYEDEAFWTTFAPFIFSEGRFERAAEQIDAILELTEPPGRDVLDLCCGPGRHAVPLAARGYRVTGVDRTAPLLELARQRATAAAVDLELVESDMRRFSRPDGFDLVLNLFTSFGYFERRDDDLVALHRMFDNLRPGGRLLIDTLGKERLAREFLPVSIDEAADGTLLVQRHTILDGWSRIRRQWILIEGERARSYTFEHTVYSGQELAERLTAVGFVDIRLYGDLQGSAYDADARRLVVVASKPRGDPASER
jgi:SAM-dependent methyltransferase